MNGLPLYGLVSSLIVAIATSAPVANEELVPPAAGIRAGTAEDMISVGKRADEMVVFGNQQNDPRVPMKKSMPVVPQEILKSATLPEVDQGSKMVVEDEIPVEEDLNDRAEAVRGASNLERLGEGLKVAEETVDVAEEDASDVKDKKEDSIGGNEVVVPSEDSSAETKVEEPIIVDLPESDGDSREVFSDEPSPVTDMEQKENISDEEADDNADEELASLSSEANGNSASEEENDDGLNGTDDADVEDFLDEVRKENEAGDEMDERVKTNSLKPYEEMAENNGVIDSDYYQTLFHILTNSYNRNPMDDYYNYKMNSNYFNRRRRSSRRRRNFSPSIRSRRNSHVRRIKRDLPSDWLAAYRGYDLPYPDDMKDALLSDDHELPYEDEEPVNEELSRYIYANLLNKLYGGNLDAAVEEVPLEDILQYDMSPELPQPLLDEYEPEEVLYEPESPYEEYIPSYEYRKRSGAGYYPDSRRKRYFYPAFEEPETHWGAIVPDKRSNYDDAIERLQRLAFALSDNPNKPYYESLLREYKKK